MNVNDKIDLKIVDIVKSRQIKEYVVLNRWKNNNNNVSEDLIPCLDINKKSIFSLSKIFNFSEKLEKDKLF